MPRLLGLIYGDDVLNIYTYVEGNPISRIDPSGLSPLHVARCVIGFGSGYLAADGLKDSTQQFKKLQAKRKCDEADLEGKAGSTNPALVNANGIAQDASNAFGPQGATFMATAAGIAGGTTRVGLPACAIGGALLGLTIGNGSAARATDQAMRDIANFLEGGP